MQNHHTQNRQDKMMVLAGHLLIKYYNNVYHVNLL